MAKLEEVASLMDVTMDIPQKNKMGKKVTGKKRRAWLQDDSTDRYIVPVIKEQHKNKGVYKPLKEGGPINPLHKPDSSTISINQVHEPQKEKGSIKGEHKPLLLKLIDLRGNPLSLVLLLFELTKDEGNRTTRRVTLTEIIQSLEISRDSSRTALRFLLKNTLIKRIQFKAGKKGWSQYVFQKELYQEIEEAILKGSITPFSSRHLDAPVKGSNISNSIYNINTTKRVDTLPPEWIAINTEPLKDIGFSQNHLKQLYKRGLNTLEVVQESINHFAFGLEYNQKKFEKYTEPLNVLMGVLRKGEAWVEANYESPQDRAMRALLEAKKRQKERRDKMMEELEAVEFEEWQRSLSEEEKRAIVPEEHLNSRLKSPVLAWLKNHFKEKILIPRLQSEGLL